MRVTEDINFKIGSFWTQYLRSKCNRLTAHRRRGSWFYTFMEKCYCFSPQPCGFTQKSISVAWVIFNKRFMKHHVLRPHPSSSGGLAQNTDVCERPSDLLLLHMKAETRSDRCVSDAHIALGTAARLVLQRYNHFCHLALASMRWAEV